MSQDKTEQAAELLKLIANSTRIRIILLLAEQPSLSASAIQEQIGIGQSLVSINLNKMRAQGALNSQRKGQEVYYCLMDVSLLEAIQIMINWV